jgi:aconitate hydratase
LNKFVSSLAFNKNTYYYCDLKKIFANYPILEKLPNSLKVLLENNIRNADEKNINDIINIFIKKNSFEKIKFFPNRVIMQDSTAIPTLIDFISFGDIEPKVQCDVIIDNLSNTNSLKINHNNNIQRDKQISRFAKFCENKYNNISVVKLKEYSNNNVNIEYLSTMIGIKSIENKPFLFPELIVGTNTQTSMINALGVLGIKVGELEAQGTILGSSISIKFPEVLGINITGSFAQGVSIWDTLLSLEDIFSTHNIKEKIVEFYGDGLKNISLEDRAVLSNIIPKYGGVLGYFGIDENTISFVEKTRGVNATLIKNYYENQTMYSNKKEPDYDAHIEFNLSKVKALIKGSFNTEEQIEVSEIINHLSSFKKGNFVNDNDIVLASISSSISSLSPTLIIQAGLLAKKACEFGIEINKNIKRTFFYDSLVVKEYLEKLDLLQYFKQLGFEFNNLSTDKEELVEIVSLDIDKFNLNVTSLSSKLENTNLKKDHNPKVKSNWFMSPALLIAFCLRGTVNCDITKEAINKNIYLSDIWPSMNEISEYLEKIDYEIYKNVYKDIYLNSQEDEDNQNYKWNEKDTYLHPSKFYDEISIQNSEIKDAKILAIFSDDISSETLCAKGVIPPYSAAATYLEAKGLRPDEFNSFESRSANSEIIHRGSFYNIELQNKIVNLKFGGFTKDFESSEIMSIYDFSLKMKKENTPLVVFAGNNYGRGEASALAAKGSKLLGIKAVIAKSFGSSYKENLIRMGILPLEFISDDSIESLGLKGDETISINTEFININSKIDIEIKKNDNINIITVMAMLDKKIEVEYYKHGGILPYLIKGK